MRDQLSAETSLTPIEIGLTAAIVAVENEDPAILVTGEAGGADQNIRTGLPFGPFDPLAHRTFESGLRAWVEAQTGLNVGYVEQLYTFGDRGRHASPGDVGPHMVSVGYLALTRMAGHALRVPGAGFQPWYRFFPWEDWRETRPVILDKRILALLDAWADRAEGATAAKARRERIRFTFGTGGSRWDEERVLERYELLYEAGLIEEARRDGREAALARKNLPVLGEPMRFDHRRILATAIARLRAKLKYGPVVFELMRREFTLTDLQRTVEAISGRRLHKQNFRRLVETSALVEPTGELSTATGGRPAALFRFRREVLAERSAAGLRVGGRS
jgi:hypothetical protein